MGMTREEAVEVLRKLSVGLMDLGNKQKWDLTEAIGLALTALRTPTREQVEKMRGEWSEHYKSGIHAGNGAVCTKCDMWNNRRSHFCPACGAPMTDEAVDIMLERLRKMNEE